MSWPKVRMRFDGLDRAGGEDYDVSVPRIPVKGDVVHGPDDFGIWAVTGVSFVYVDGLAFEPQVIAVLQRAA